MIPKFPPDATIRSILGAIERLSIVNLSDTQIRPIVDNYVRHRAQYHNAGQIASLLLRDRVSAETLATSHSSVAFHGKFLSKSHELEWSRAAGKELPLAKRNLQEQSVFEAKQAPELRYCEECVDEDLVTYGCAHWHVSHQLMPICHCPKHRVRLHSQCRGCGAPFYTGRSDNRVLPRDPCPKCGSRDGAATDRQFSEGYWRFWDLCCRALQDEAPELRPLARQAIVPRVQSCLREGGHSDEARDRLFASWGVSSLQGFVTQLCSKVGQQGFERLMSSGAAAAPNFVTAAVVSFAIANLPSVLIAEALGDADTVAIDKPPNPAQDLEESLVAHARRCAYPVDLAQALARGTTLTAVLRNGRATNAAHERFLASLSDDLRSRISKARNAQRRVLSKRPRVGTTSYAAKMRRIAKRLLATGDNRRGSLSKQAYYWLKKHDTAWLNENFPKHHGKDLEQAKAQTRGVALGFKAKGVRTPRELQAAASATFHWLHSHDNAWLTHHFPGAKLFDPKERQAKWRAIASAIARDHGRTRRDIRVRDAVAYQWLLANDRAWLDEMFPRQTVSSLPPSDSKVLESRDASVARSPDVDHEEGGSAFPRSSSWGKRPTSLTADAYRSLAIDARNDGLTRTNFGRRDRAAYYWLLENDREWFDGAVPSRRGERSAKAAK